MFKTHYLPDVTVHLDGGSSPNVGTVIVSKSGETGPICHYNWDINDAHVVCRMLGYQWVVLCVWNLFLKVVRSRSSVLSFKVLNFVYLFFCLLFLFIPSFDINCEICIYLIQNDIFVYVTSGPVAAFGCKYSILATCL